MEMEPRVLGQPGPELRSRREEERIAHEDGAAAATPFASAPMANVMRTSSATECVTNGGFSSRLTFGA